MYTDFDIYNYIVTVTSEDDTVTKYFSPPAITLQPNDIVEVVGIFRDTKRKEEIVPIVIPAGLNSKNSKTKTEYINIFIVNDNTQPDLYLTAYLDVDTISSVVNFQLNNTKDYYYLVKFDNSTITNPQSIKVMSEAIFVDAVRKLDNVTVDSTIESIEKPLDNLLLNVVDSEIVVINY
jgi:hypothetical protein